MKISVLGIDLGKNTFHLFGVDDRGREVLRKRLTRSKLLNFMVNLPSCLVGMEACGGAHHLARVLSGHGHDVRLMSPQFVKPYVKSNKNDYLDAEAICEAVQRPTMRFVPVKSVACQDIQMLHRARSHVVANRTAQGNQIRGFLLEYGVVVAQGIGVLRRRLVEILEDGENGLSMAAREILDELRETLVALDERVSWYDARIKRLASEHEDCVRLQSIPGVGPMVATALVAAVGDARAFPDGRALAAWVGLVPKQRSTGGHTRLLGISKRGDPYLRMLLIHGARAVLRVCGSREDRRSRWVRALAARRGNNIAAVALANKIARTAWALLTRGEHYQVFAASGAQG